MTAPSLLGLVIAIDSTFNNESRRVGQLLVLLAVYGDAQELGFR
jgi:hypothetical protein